MKNSPGFCPKMPKPSKFAVFHGECVGAVREPPAARAPLGGDEPLLTKSFVAELFTAPESPVNAERRSGRGRRFWFFPWREAIRVRWFQPRPGGGRFANRPYGKRDDYRKFDIGE